ncbi:MAG: nucleotidyltransferase [Myxococcales bacterium]|nr:nucleotidyltransferase [Myxococcales bacterium]
MDLPPDFRDLLAELGRADVEYVLVGGWAVAFHGRPRATKDIDFVLRGTPENLERAAEALGAFGAPASICAAVRTMAPSDVVYLGQAPLRVDFLREISGVTAEDLFARATSVVLDQLPLRVASIDDLIANKRTVGRPQDLIDVAFLERARDQRK